MEAFLEPRGGQLAVQCLAASLLNWPWLTPRQPWVPFSLMDPPETQGRRYIQAECSEAAAPVALVGRFHPIIPLRSVEVATINCHMLSSAQRLIETCLNRSVHELLYKNSENEVSSPLTELKEE